MLRKTITCLQRRHKLQLAQQPHARQPPPPRHADAEVAARLMELAEKVALRGQQASVRPPNLTSMLRF